jgi:predicted DNA-binding transcriptional regulator AlpA
MPNILRKKTAIAKIGVGRSAFDSNYVEREGGDPFLPGTKIPRLKPVMLGDRSVGFVDDEIDALIRAMRQVAKPMPAKCAKPAIHAAKQSAA